MKIHKISGFLLLTGILFMVPSCDDEEFLTEYPKSFNAPDNTFTSTKGFNTAVNGLYSQAQSEYRDIVYGTLYSGTDLCLNALTHPVYKVVESLGENLNSAYYGCETFWNWAYTFIANANMILEALELSDVNWDSPSDKVLIEAQTRFFRAYAYRTLSYTFGGVPIVLKVAKPFKLDYTKSSLTDVLDLMISDFTFAANNLPAEVTEEGRIVKAAAQHYLAEAHMYKEEWTTAEALLNSIISSPLYSLMTERFGMHLSEEGDVFSDIFKEDNANRSSGNLESIWVIQMQYNWDQGFNYFKDWSRRAMVLYYSRVTGFLLCDSLGGRGVGRLRPTDFWLNSYESQDIRNSGFNLRRKYYYNDPTHEDFGKEFPMTDELKESGSLYASTRKFDFGKTVDNPAYAFNEKDNYKIRLAETYLLLAEAQFKQGKLDDAATSINMVRIRANATPVLPAEVTLDYILDERARELFGEYPRKYTLTRTGTFVDRVKMHNAVTAEFVQEFNALWPIPQSAIDANQGAELVQNPGY